MQKTAPASQSRCDTEDTEPDLQLGSAERHTRIQRFMVLRQTLSKRLRARLNEVKAELQGRMHKPILEQASGCRV